MQSDPRFERYRLMQSRCVNGAWSKATPAPFAVPGVQEGDPGITPDGQRLYFISMRHDPAQENFDIWYVERTGADTWSEPRRLPEPVNSPGAELLPRADRDGHLYFGSDRAGGFGQGDIYVASAEARRRNGPSATSVRRSVLPPMNMKRKSRRMAARWWLSSTGEIAPTSTNSSARRTAGSSAVVFPRTRTCSRSARSCHPTRDRLLFAQAHGARSGELFLIDLVKEPDERWPACSR